MRRTGVVTIVAFMAATTSVWFPVDVAAQQPEVRRITRGVPCQRVNVRSKQHMTALPATVVVPRRTPEGWPDLQGTWSNGAYGGGSQHSIEVGRDPAGIFIECRDPATNMGSVLVDPMRGMIPYQPWAQAKRMDYLAAWYAPQRRMDVPPAYMCAMYGVSRAPFSEDVWELRYVPGYIVIFSDTLAGKGTRFIPMDDRPHLPSDVKLFMGDSRGRWEGNTLVVETVNNRDGTWFDTHGTFHSEDLRITERWTMVDENTLFYEAVYDDPAVFTQPWRVALNYDRVNRANPHETREDSCHEGERNVDLAVRVGLRARQLGLRGYHIHVDLETGKAIRPEEQKYLDESKQPLGHSYAPVFPDQP